MKVLLSREQALLKRAKEGCRGSFDEVVRSHYKGVFAHALRLLGNQDDAADAVQVTFVKAGCSLAEFDLERDFRPWLYRICTNVCIDIARGRKRACEPLGTHAYHLESDSDPESEASRAQLASRVRAAVERLPGKYKRAIVLRHFAQMDVGEIARSMGTPEGTVKRWLFRARGMLKQELAGTGTAA
ncbi:MAG: RNA polymerase subunit sigma-24 [Armatimonadota bacterium]